MNNAISVGFQTLQIRRAWIFVFFLIAVFVFCSSASSESRSSKHGKVRSTRSGEVYLFRGLTGMFSSGLDELAKEINRKGVRARVFPHQAWRSIANDLILRSKIRKINYPIILIGHSRGGTVTLRLANKLGPSNIPIKYVATLDPIKLENVNFNIRYIQNYYLPKNSKSKKLKKGKRFSGRLRNIDVSKHFHIDHYNIDQNKKIQHKVLNHILAITKTKRF